METKAPALIEVPNNAPKTCSGCRVAKNKNTDKAHTPIICIPDTLEAEVAVIFNSSDQFATVTSSKRRFS